VLAFSRHTAFSPLIIPDERAAAYLAIGVSLAHQAPVVLICTSGTAALNYLPAVAEAWYQEIPLLVLTADRPAECVDQLDNQAIHQRAMYEPYVHGSFDWPCAGDRESDGEAIACMAAALKRVLSKPAGPVHVNLPFREPFYPRVDNVVDCSGMDLSVKSGSLPDLDSPSWKRFKQLFSSAKRILVVIGQTSPGTDLGPALVQLLKDERIVCLADVTSNVGGQPCVCYSADLFLGAQSYDPLQYVPDLMIYVGGPILSKRVKEFYRQHAPREMWRIQLSPTIPDTFRCLSGSIVSDPASTLLRMTEEAEPSTLSDASWRQVWETSEQSARRLVERFLHSGRSFNELEVVGRILEALPSDAHLHLGSSMPVRWADIVGTSSRTGPVYANRGTSGIDGCVATAVGAAIASSDLHVLICGDMTFQYGRNAFWHTYPLDNLVVIILNNGGGGIFKMIPGSSEQPECDQYFVTEQTWTAMTLAQDKNLSYESCNDYVGLEKALNGLFCKGSSGKVLEIFIHLDTSRDIYRELRREASDI
jgi:2-succinyl-5-enolpyruvyl-6-hydroxy-3-cyclohexene-1-carboxylate synthase